MVIASATLPGKPRIRHLFFPRLFATLKILKNKGISDSLLRGFFLTPLVISSCNVIDFFARMLLRRR